MKFKPQQKKTQTQSSKVKESEEPLSLPSCGYFNAAGKKTPNQQTKNLLSSHNTIKIYQNEKVKKTPKLVSCIY